jgi:hypothetical protein
VVPRSINAEPLLKLIAIRLQAFIRLIAIVRSAAPRLNDNTHQADDAIASSVFKQPCKGIEIAS